MAGYFLEEFCQRYSWLEVVPLYWELDGTFPNHEADPLKLENLAPLQQLVREKNCDFGVCFDGDADRAAFVDEQGQIISSDLITAIIAENYLSQSPQKTGIIYDLRSSDVVKELIESKGGRPIRTKVGHAFMKKVLRDEDAKFGGELSGHYYFADCFYTDSALMAVIQMLNIYQHKQQSLSTLIAPLRKYYSSGEISFRVDDVAEILQKVQDKYSDYQQDQLDGLTVRADQWWFNLRPSNTEPLLRLIVEAKQPNLKDQTVAEIKSLVNA